jgi:hypothetical protein
MWLLEIGMNDRPGENDRIQSNSQKWSLPNPIREQTTRVVLSSWGSSMLGSSNFSLPAFTQQHCTSLSECGKSSVAGSLLLGNLADTASDMQHNRMSSNER